MSLPYAQLLVDTGSSPVAGARGPGDERQLVFRHAGLQLDVMFQSGGPRATFVWGQLCRVGSGRPCEGACVTLVDEDARGLARAVTDAFGEFSFSAPRLVEGAIDVETTLARFLCWLAHRPAAEAEGVAR